MIATNEPLRVASLHLGNWKRCIDAEPRPIDKLNILIGGMGTGKTGYLSGLMFACRGHTNRGKLPEVTSKFCGPTGGAVSVGLSDGFRWTRSLMPRADGAGREMFLTVSGLMPPTLQKTEGFLSAKIGDYAPMWNPLEFLALSPDKQRDHVLNLANRNGGAGDHLDAAGLRILIAYAFLRRHLGWGDDHQESAEGMSHARLNAIIKDNLAPAMATELLRQAADLDTELSGSDVGMSISAAQAKQEQVVNASKRDADRARLAAQELSARKAEINAPAQHIDILKVELDRLADAEKALLVEQAAEAERRQHIATVQQQIAAREAQTTENANEAASTRETAPTEESAAQHDADAAKSAEALNVWAGRRDVLMARRQALFDERAALSGVSAGDNSGATEAALADLMAVAVTLEASIGDEKRSAADIRSEADSLLAYKPGEDPHIAKTAAELQKAMEAEEDSAVDVADCRVLLQQKEYSRARAHARCEASAWLTELANLFDRLTKLWPGPHSDEVDKLCYRIGEIIGEHLPKDNPTEALVAAQKEVSGANAALTTARAVDENCCNARKALEVRLDELRRENAEAVRVQAEAMTTAATLQILAGRVAESARIRQQVAEMQQQLAEQAEAAQRVEQAKKRLAELDALVGNLSNELAQISEREREAEHDRDEALRLARETRSRMQADAAHVAELERQIADNNAALVDLRAKLLDLERVGESVNAVPVESRLATVRRNLAEAKARIETKQRYDVLDAELAHAVAEAERRQLAHDVGKDLVLAIKAVRERIMSALTAPLVDQMNRFLAAMDGDTRAYIELDNTGGGKRVVFEFGWYRQRDGQAEKVALCALSGGEAAIYVAALAYALTMLADPPLKLLLIEAAEIDAPHLVTLLRCVEGVQDSISNALVATHIRLPHPMMSAWNVMDMDESATPADQANDTTPALASA